MFEYLKKIKSKFKVRDPYRATIGLGLGIAGLNEGGAETSLMNQVYSFFN